MNVKFKLWLLLTCSALHLPAIASLCGPCNFAATPTYTEVVTDAAVVSFSSQGCLAVNSGVSTVRLYSVDPATCTATFNPPAIEQVDVNAVLALAFSPSGSCLAVANSTAIVDPLSLYSINPDCTVGELTDTIAVPTSIANSAQAIAFSQGCLAVASAGTNEVYLYPINAACEQAGGPNTITLPPGSFNANSVAFSPDGNCLAVTVGSAVPFVALYTIVDCTATLSDTISLGGLAATGPIAFSPDGSCLAVVAGGTTVNLYPIVDCIAPDDPIDTITVANAITSLSFSSSCLAIANGNLIDIYAISGCTAGASPAQTITAIGTVRSIAFAPDGTCLASIVFEGGEGDTILSLFQSTVVPPLVTNATPGCNSITVMGTTRAGASVTIFINGVSATTVDADASGLFAAMLPVVPGTYAITAQAADPVSGCLSELSAAVSVAVPSGPSIDQVTSTCLGTINIVGSAAPGTSITILVDGVPAATGTAIPFGGFGRFVIVNVPVSTGFHCISAIDNASGCVGAPVCLNVTLTSCVLIRPNLAFGTHCCTR